MHTYSGYENTVKATIEKTIETRHLQDLIHVVSIPMETVTEITDNGPKTYDRKVFPGYVLVKMIMSDEAWYIIKNVRGVTGFVGAGNKATPLSETDFASVFDSVPQTRLDIQVGDNVRILSGLFENFSGKVTQIDLENQKIKVVVPMLKRETDVELNYDEVVRED